MADHNRRKRLLQLLNKHGELGFGELVEKLHASKATVRRDLTWLEDHDLVSRRRGLAIRKPSQIEGELQSKISVPPTHAVPEKRVLIAQFAATLCCEGDTIILSGNDTSPLCSFLPRKNINVLTNSIQAADVLLRQTQNEVYLTAGAFNRQHKLILRKFDSDRPMYMEACRMFMYASAMTKEGLGTSNSVLVKAERYLMEHAKHLVVLADSDSFHQPLEHLVCSFSRVHRVITDWQAPPEIVAQLRAAGVIVDVVGSPQRALNADLAPLIGRGYASTFDYNKYSNRAMEANALQ